MSQNPRVSVVIPSYNRANLSLRAINSVLQQSYQNIELIFINDGSTEDYTEIEDILSQVQAKYFKTPNRGISHARNLGIENSSGEFIALLDSDDEWLAQKISKQVEVFRDNEEYKVVQALEFWIRNGKPLKVPEKLKPAHGESFEKALEYCCIGPSSVLMRREIFDEIGLFDPLLRVCEDYDLWLRVLDRYSVYCIQEELSIKYGGHADQLSFSEEALDRFRVYGLVKYLTTATDKAKIELVLKSLNGKLDILESGAKKRDLSEDVLRYGEMKSLLASYIKLKDPKIIEDLFAGSILSLDFKQKRHD